MTPKRALKQAIKASGTAKQLAGSIRVAPSTITYWLAKGRVAPEHVLAIEYVTGVSRHDLRPDLYPRENAAD